ncbi:MAG TPA: hypothetical protein VFQ42_22505 [Mycobacterium sp.]|nr:hypothetical protein [Mycobacterium sp.]
MSPEAPKCRPSAAPRNIGQDWRATCPTCGKRVPVKDGKWARHTATPQGGVRKGSGREVLGDDGLTAVIPATRVTPGERQLAEDMVEKLGISISGVVRRAIAELAQRVLK